MSEYSWDITRADAIDRFHETPKPDTEQQIIDVFAQRPGLIVGLITSIANEKASGRDIRSCWAVLKSRAQGAATDPTGITATDEGDRERLNRNARNWITNAGIYIDRQDELEAELFGDAGRLRHHTTPALRQEMIDLWKQQRPRGQRAEQASLEWDETCRKSLAVMRAYRAGKLTAEPATLGNVAEDTRKP